MIVQYFKYNIYNNDKVSETIDDLISVNKYFQSN